MSDTSGLDAEALRKDCFLCRPNAALLAHVGVSGYALAGLGPLADGYAVVATHEHMQGLVEVSREERAGYARYAVDVASRLVIARGGCFIVEHGNMAVCGIDLGDRAHCFHPHFLLIPDERCSLQPFQEFFSHEHPQFATLEEAIEFGVTQGQYVLAGQASGPFQVFLPEKDLPRQLARALVAEQIDVIDLASWRDAPNVDWAIRNANLLRGVLHSL